MSATWPDEVLQSVEKPARYVGGEVNAAVLPDHPVPVAIGKHTRMPVPVSVRKAGMAPDSVQTFDEIACKQGSLGAMSNGDLMNLLFQK